MSDSSIRWQETFSELFNSAGQKYRCGHTRAVGLVDTRGVNFLISIGYTEQEFFDFVEDFVKGGEPTLETSLAIAAIRRDYFLNEQGGKTSNRQVAMRDLPPKDEEIEGIAWLPRIIAKAEAKLRGEMPSDLMYGCGGDRRFLRAHGIDAAEFLEKTREAGGRQEQIVAWLKGSASR